MAAALGGIGSRPRLPPSVRVARGRRPGRTTRTETPMLRNAIIALVIALILFALGFSGLGQIAWIIAGVFFVLFLIALVMHLTKKV